MKKVKFAPFLCLIALIGMLVLCLVGLSGEKKAYAEPSSAYKFEVAKYDVQFDISNNCSIAVSEEITISYQGYASTGFIRDIPVNGGAQVRGVKVSKLVNGVPQSVYYNVFIEDSDFISVDIGDSTLKQGKEETYLLTYTYNITNKVVNKGILALNPIGYGWECAIYDASVKLILPEGYKGAKCYSGMVGTTERYDFDDTQRTSDGRVVISATAERLSPYNGITFDLSFEDGAIKSYSEFTPYLFAIIGIVILAAVILLKVFLFNKSYLTPVVNYDAPDGMDPLIMGKLIDNSVNSEDITSLIYYWASKGYIKINLDDKDDPVLIRIMHNLPASCAEYEQTMYNNLFSGGDVVKPSKLRGSFYRVVEKVTAQVNGQAKGLYDGKSFGISVLFAVIGTLLMGLAPFLFALTQIGGLIYAPSLLVALICAVVVYVATLMTKFYRYKVKKALTVLFAAGIALISLIFSFVFAFIVPASIIATAPKILLCLVCCAVVSCSVLIISRTDDYTEKLNNILGFRNFILLAEKDQLEMMIDEDPQFYYHILPYAQVLGVSDKWEEKFADLTIEPPQWLTGNYMTTVFEFHMINSIIRSSMMNMRMNMVSRPSSSGSNGGGFGGGFSGGFGGGGFGGGGGRGR